MRHDHFLLVLAQACFRIGISGGGASPGEDTLRPLYIEGIDSIGGATWLGVSPDGSVLLTRDIRVGNTSHAFKRGHDCHVKRRN
jgi:hypothetical protein